MVLPDPVLLCERYAKEDEPIESAGNAIEVTIEQEQELEEAFDCKPDNTAENIDTEVEIHTRPKRLRRQIKESVPEPISKKNKRNYSDPGAEPVAAIQPAIQVKEENICETDTIVPDESLSTDPVPEVPVKRGRGRPRGSTNANTPNGPVKQKSPPKKRLQRLAAHMDLPLYDVNDESEGVSGDEIPARESGDEDCADEMPKEILKDGKLLFKGARLMRIICK